MPTIPGRSLTLGDLMSTYAVPNSVPLPSGAAGDMGDPATLANRVSNPSVMDPAWLRMTRRGAQGLGTLADIIKGAVVTGGSEEPGMTGENLGAIIGAALPLLGKIVYHGSPHVFDKFDMGKIGTGEGNQAYGHGLYFADAPGVAKSYRPSAASVSVGGKPVPTQTVAEQMLEARLAQAYENGHSNPIGNVRAGLSLDRQTISSEGMKKEYDEALRLLDEWNKSGITENRLGMLADVDLPDDAIAKMLDWDAPLSEQPGKIPLLADEFGLDAAEATGSDLYTKIKAGFQEGKGDPRSAPASRYLRKLGIPGIRYYDGASRGAGQGTRNYVVFDDQLPKIVKVTR